MQLTLSFLKTHKKMPDLMYGPQDKQYFQFEVPKHLSNFSPLNTVEKSLCVFLPVTGILRSFAYFPGQLQFNTSLYQLCRCNLPIFSQDFALFNFTVWNPLENYLWLSCCSVVHRFEIGLSIIRVYHFHLL